MGRVKLATASCLRPTSQPTYLPTPPQRVPTTYLPACLLPTVRATYLGKKFGAFPPASARLRQSPRALVTLKKKGATPDFSLWGLSETAWSLEMGPRASGLGQRGGVRLWPCEDGGPRRGMMGIRGRRALARHPTNSKPYFGPV